MTHIFLVISGTLIGSIIGGLLSYLLIRGRVSRATSSFFKEASKSKEKSDT